MKTNKLQIDQVNEDTPFKSSFLFKTPVESRTFDYNSVEVKSLIRL